MEVGPDVLLQMYAGMLRVRLLEERVRELFAAGRIPGFLHTSIGQEAIAVGTGAWRAWVVMEAWFDDLDAPIARVAGPNIPIPFSPPSRRSRRRRRTTSSRPSVRVLK